MKELTVQNNCLIQHDLSYAEAVNRLNAQVSNSIPTVTSTSNTCEAEINFTSSDVSTNSKYHN